MKQHQKHVEFQCFTCHYVLDDQNTYYDHIQLHKNQPKGHCVICNKPFKSGKDLQRHVRGHVSFDIENIFSVDFFSFAPFFSLHRTRRLFFVIFAAKVLDSMSLW